MNTRHAGRPALAPTLAALLLVASACAEPRLIDGAGVCTPCHEAPPATGAHLLHANPQVPASWVYGSAHVLADVEPGAAGALRYDFGCGNCHPLDAGRHYQHAGERGLPEVELAPTGAPAGSLRAMNAPGARYDPVSGTCSGVYCHSSGQASPAFAETPAWTATPGLLGCGGCHGNPPSYPSGGSGAADANSHLDLDLENLTTAGWEPGVEFGHFAGLPGPNHWSKHGTGDPESWNPQRQASPITCQACHFDSVDPANVRPGGSFYFDATGDYDLSPAGWSERTTYAQWQGMQCSTAGCHGGDLGRGRALALRHVNGRRDVAFDPREAVPAPSTLPALAAPGPVRPYYFTMSGNTAFSLAPADCATNRVPSCGVAEDVLVRDTADGNQVLTLKLSSARYDPATKTCSSVACHLERQRQVDAGAGQAPTPLRWGTPFRWGVPATCSGCHER